MATVIFTGDATISNSTSLLALSGISLVNTVSYTTGEMSGANRIRAITGTNQGSGEALQSIKLTTTGLSSGPEIVTNLFAQAGVGGTAKSIVEISGLRISTDFDSADPFSAENLEKFQTVVASCLSGDDNFVISGAVTQIWGDYQSVADAGGMQFGDDIMTISYITQVPGSIATFYGDAQSIHAGANAIAGDDILDAGLSIVPVTFYGDFQTDSGNVTFGNDELYGSTKDDVLYGDSQVSGKRGGQDYLYGGDGNDELHGGGGNDFLVGGFGKDIIDGGAGYDIASYAQSDVLLTELVVDMADASKNTNAATGDVLIGIEGLKGRNITSSADDLRGDDYSNKIWGLAGQDTLSGRDGKDMLYGGDGNDRLLGGSGSDKLIGGDGFDAFVFDTALHGKQNVDRIMDFNIGLDRIELDHAIFTALGLPGGNLSDLEFHASKTGRAHDATDRILYEKDTGKLFYDEDGDGNSNAVLFAVLSAKPNITEADFDIV